MPNQYSSKKITLTSTGSAGTSGASFGASDGTIRPSTGSVTFDVTPEIEEQGSTAYIIEDSVRAPASIIIWMGSPSRTFNINAKFLSRTVEEARFNYKQKSFLQAWRMPTTKGVGNSSAPELIQLSGYGDNFQDISCIVRSVTFSYPTDVDYIDIGNASIPIVWPVSVQLLEYHTIEDMESTYDYGKFKSGTLEGWN